MKKRAIVLALAFMLIFPFVMFGCGSDDGVTSVNFWGWGDPDEIEVFSALVAQFNEENPTIRVKYTQKPADSYSSATAQALSGRNGPDVVYVGDGNIKQWAKLNLLAPMDEYLAESTAIDPTDMWASSLDRYRINTTTMESGGTNPLFAVPKDIGPTVIYYNEDAMAHSSVNVKVISVDAEDIDAFNSNEKADLRGKKRSDYGIPEVSANGYKEYSGVRVFNNRIAMTWFECVELSKLMTKNNADRNGNAYNSNSPTEYGYFTEWWFSYGWSVGGDCTKYNSATGKWEFTLGATNKMWLKDGKFYESDPGGGTQMTYSQKDAFTHFVQLSQKTSVDVDGNGSMGLAITPSPNTLGTQGKVGYFTSGKVAMLVDIKASTIAIRKNASFDWDIAPLPKSPDGIEAGHSGSMGMAINAKSKVKEAAWKFCEFIAGEEGQTAQAEKGFNIPNQKSIANTDVFLQPNQKPKNSSIYLRVAEYQGPGDWWYLSDGAWISEWAPLLNGDVRNGDMNLTQFFNEVTSKTNKKLEEYTN